MKISKDPVRPVKRKGCSSPGTPLKGPVQDLLADGLTHSSFSTGAAAWKASGTEKAAFSQTEVLESRQSNLEKEEQSWSYHAT